MKAFTLQMTDEMIAHIHDIAAARSYTKSEDYKRISAAEIVRRCIDKAIGRMAVHSDGRKRG